MEAQLTLVDELFGVNKVLILAITQKDDFVNVEYLILQLSQKCRLPVIGITY